MAVQAILDSVPASAPDPVSVATAVETKSTAGEATPVQRPKRPKSGRGRLGPANRAPAMKFDGDGAAGRKKPSEQGRKAPDGAPSARAKAREDLLGFTPIASVPHDQSTATVVTEHAYGLFKRHYGRASVTLYNLFSYLPILLRQNGFSEEESLEIVGSLEVHINANLKKLTGVLESSVGEIRQKANEAGVARPGQWTRPARPLNLPIYAPQSVDFMQALTLFDELAAFHIGLWLARETSVKTRETNINFYRNLIAVEIRKLIRLYQGAKEYSQKRDLSQFVKLMGPVSEADLPEMLSPEEEEQAAKLVALAESDAQRSPVEAMAP